MGLLDCLQDPGLQESPLFSAPAKADPSTQAGDGKPHACSSSAWVRILALPFPSCVNLGKVPSILPTVLWALLSLSFQAFALLFPLPGTLFRLFLTWLTALHLRLQFSTPSGFCLEAPILVFPLIIMSSSFWLLSARTDCLQVTVTFPTARMCPKLGDAQ